MLQGNRMMQRVLPTLNDSSIIIYFHSLHKTTRCRMLFTLPLFHVKFQDDPLE